MGLPETSLTWLALALGGLAPDLDGGGTIARPSNFLPKITPKPVLIILDQIGLTISKLVQSGLGHRGGLHWPLWGAALIFAGAYYAMPWLYWFGVGYLFHIAGDALTVAGVPLLGPVSQRKVSLFPMRTGSKLESGIAVLLWGVIGYQAGLIGLDWLNTLYQQGYDYMADVVQRLSLR